jgi:signal transduction histidine kinase
VSRDDEALERVKEHLRTLSTSLPDLIEHLRVITEAVGEERPLPDAHAELHRLHGLAEYLDRFGKRGDTSVGPLDVKDIVVEAVALTQGEIGRKGRVLVSCFEAPHVNANGRALGQVFVSMLINASHALPAGAPTAHYVAVELDTNEEGWARVAIADSGSGISADELLHVFQPLYSTKRGHGMGLGLAIVREIIYGLGGKISVESHPGGGTLFIIELPPA